MNLRLHIVHCITINRAPTERERPLRRDQQWRPGSTCGTLRRVSALPRVPRAATTPSAPSLRLLNPLSEPWLRPRCRLGSQPTADGASGRPFSHGRAALLSSAARPALRPGTLADKLSGSARGTRDWPSVQSLMRLLLLLLLLLVSLLLLVVVVVVVVSLLCYYYHDLFIIVIMIIIIMPHPPTPAGLLRPAPLRQEPGCGGGRRQLSAVERRREGAMKCGPKECGECSSFWHLRSLTQSFARLSARRLEASSTTARCVPQAASSTASASRFGASTFCVLGAELHKAVGFRGTF